MALWPDPPGCTGHNIWRMLSERTGASQEDYVRVFDRRNLLSERHWDPVRARRESETLWERLEGRTVLVLGQAVRCVLWLPDEPPLLWRVSSGVRWCSVPHPSGLNRWYNEPVHREAVALRLEELYEHHRHHVSCSGEQESM